MCENIYLATISDADIFNEHSKNWAHSKRNEARHAKSVDGKMFFVGKKFSIGKKVKALEAR